MEGYRIRSGVQTQEKGLPIRRSFAEIFLERHPDLVLTEGCENTTSKEAAREGSCKSEVEKRLTKFDDIYHRQKE